MIRRQFLQTAGAIGLSIPRRSPGQSPEPGTFTYKTAAGCEIRADVYGAAPGASRPAVMWMHGGALIFGNRKSLTRPFQAGLLQLGYVIVSIDYRLAPETKLPAIIEDIQDAYRWMRDQAMRFGIDRDRIATGGGSAGGYLTQMTGFCLDPRPRALVSYFGYGDLIGPWYSEPDEFYRRHLYCRQNGLWPKEVAGHDPHTDRKWFDRYCPVRNVTAKYPPTILIHGTKDTDVPYSLSQDMDARLSQAGVEHEFVTVGGAGHGLAGAKPEEIAQAADSAVRFVTRHTT